MALESRNLAPERAKLRACTWIRVSTAEQAEDGRGGIPRQLDCIARVVAQKSYEVVRAFQLSDVSGSATLYAPETHELLDLIQTRQIDVVLASEMSRLCRPDDIASLQVLDFCKRHQVLVDLGGTIHDFDSPDGYLTGMLSGMIAGYERMTMKKRVESAKEAMRSRGLHPGSDLSLPLGVGYDRKAGRYILNAEVTKVIEAFRLVDEGIRNLAEVGRQAGIHPANVRNILRNAIYRGERIYDKKRNASVKGLGKNGRQKDKPKTSRKPEEVIRIRVFSADEQPVSDEQWNRVQDILQGIRRNHSVFVAERHIGNLLAGTGRCGYCGERLYGR